MNRLERLYDEAMERLEDGEPEEALRLAAQLEKRGYSGAYEVGARALADLERPEEAVAHLEKGLERVDDVWINWMLLGSYRSDLGRYDEAAAAYERALACPDVPADTIRVNQAVLANRRGDPETAATLLDAITDPELDLFVADLRARLALDREAFDEAAATAFTALRDIEDDDEFDLNAAARLAGRLAEAKRGLGEPVESVRETILHGMCFDASEDYLLQLLRELDPTPSPDGRWYRLTAEGRDDTPDVAGFIVVHQIAANSAADALAYARVLEDAEGCRELAIDEIEDIERCTDMPLGVYSRTGRAYFAEE